MPKITAKYIEAQVAFPTSGQLIIRDDELKGFGLRVTKGMMSFVVERRDNGKLRRITLGRYGVITPDEARRKARKLLSGVVAIKATTAKSADYTLKEILEKYLEVRTLRQNTIRNYTQVTKRCLGDWLDLPVTSVTRDMIQSRHRALTRTTRRGTSGEAQANLAMRILRTLLNFAANNFETADAQPIITMNPVRTLSQNRSWHRERRRRVIVSDNKLGEWYRAVMSGKSMLEIICCFCC
jgi:hypothetical protein